MANIFNCYFYGGLIALTAFVWTVVVILLTVVNEWLLLAFLITQVVTIITQLTLISLIVHILKTVRDIAFETCLVTTEIVAVSAFRTEKRVGLFIVRETVVGLFDADLVQ